MFYKHCEHMQNIFFFYFSLYFEDVFNKTITPLVLAGHEMIKPVQCYASHWLSFFLISIHLWNSC